MTIKYPECQTENSSVPTIAKNVLLRSLIHCSAVVIILLIVFGNIHCGRGDDRTKTDASTITILYPGDESYLGHYNNMDPRLLIFDPLISWDQNEELEGRLAESWQHSSDYRTWTVNLHKDAGWHDGVPVTSHDIKFTLDLMSHPDVSWLPPRAYSINIIDEKTYAITHNFGGVGNYNSMDSWEVYYPKHLLENLEPKELCKWEFWSNPVGSGPYRYVRHVPKEFVELEANPDYYRGKPRIDRVILKFGEQIVMELLSGNVDAAVWASRIDILKLKGDPRFREYNQLNPWHEGIYWNQKRQKFRDPRVRRALTLAINRKELMQVLNLPEDIPIVDGSFTRLQFLSGELPEPLAYDPELAKRMLDEAGWIDLDKNGVREKGGEEFRFTAMARELSKSAVYVQEQFRRVGIRMEVLTLAQETLLERYWAGDFEAIFWLFAVGITRRLSNLFSKDSPIGYHNPQIENLLTDAMETIDPRDQDRICKELWPIFQTDVPITFLYPNIETYIVQRRVKGLNSFGRANPILHMHHLWIEEED